jgi:hypothetical protein
MTLVVFLGGRKGHASKKEIGINVNLTSVAHPSNCLDFDAISVSTASTPVRQSENTEEEPPCSYAGETVSAAVSSLDRRLLFPDFGFPS